MAAVVYFRIYIDVTEARSEVVVIFFVNIEGLLLSEEVSEYHLQETMVRVHVYIMEAVLIPCRFKRTDDLGAALHAHSDQQPIRYASSWHLFAWFSQSMR